MRLYIRLKEWLTKHGAFLGILFFTITGFNALVYYPDSTTSVTGYIDNITIEKRYSSDKYKTHYYYEYKFHIKDKEYSKYIVKNENYDYLIGKEVMINYHPDRYNENDIEAITYNNKVVFSMDEYIPMFVKWLVLFVLSIVFFIWLLVLKFRNTETTPKINTTEIEEYFFNNWSIMRKNDKYILSYISKLDGDIKRIKITEEEFTLTKLSKMTLDDFISKYNLW